MNKLFYVLLHRNVMFGIILSLNLKAMFTPASAQESYIVTTFNGNIEAKEERILIIDDGESVTLKPTIPNDTFDGTVIDATKWEQTTWNGAAIEQNNKLVFSIREEIVSSIAEIETRYEFLDDFDVQVDFEIGHGWANPSSEHLDGAVMGINIGSTQCHLTIIKQSNGDQQIMLYSFEKGVIATFNTITNTGKYKITRTGVLFRFWYDIGSGWKELGSIAISSVPVKIYLQAGSINVKHAFTTFFYNFKINSGATSYRNEAKMRLFSHGFVNTVLLDSLQVDAALPVGSMLAAKLYGKENIYPKWKLLGEYQFDHYTKKVAVGTPAYVDSLRYGLTGSEGIKFITTNTDSIPILNSITLKTRFEESPPDLTVIQPTPNSTEKWDIYELTLINKDTFFNPFWDVAVCGNFTGPNSQEIFMEGFYYDTNTWKIRFSPTQEGLWQYSIRFATGKSANQYFGNFICTPSVASNHGFIEIDDSKPHKFVYSDGTPFIVVGICAGEPVSAGVYLGFPAGANQVSEAWDYISSKHINTMRIFFHHQPQFETVFPWNSLEGQANLLAEAGGLDRYNLTNAKLIDRWFAQSKEHGVNFYLCLFNVFDIGNYLPFSSSFWSKSNGGPYARLEDMFSNKDSKGLELEKKYCKYVVNRWSSYRNIVAWEYNNEQGVNCTNSWLSEIDDIIDQLDPYSRPHTVSFWSNNWSKDSQVNYSPTIDITDDHFYPTAGRKLGLLNNNNEFNVDSLVHSEITDRVNKFNKIAVFSEFGQESETWDWNKRISQHNYDRIALWTTYIAGAFPIFWFPGPNETNGYAYNRLTIDYLDSFYRIISMVKDFLTTTPNNQSVSVSDKANVRAYCLANDNEFLVYVHHYPDHSTTMRDKKMSISLPASQHYQANWFDPSTGQMVSGEAGITSNGSANLTIPDFVVDIVLYLESYSNFVPKISTLPDTTMNYTDTLYIDLNKYVEDIDNPDSTLTWSVNNSNDSLQISIDKYNIATFTSLPFEGLVTVLFTVKDDKMSEDQDTMFINVTIPTLVNNENASLLPKEFSLFQNFPNPFNAETVIDYVLPKQSDVSIKIYNILGEEITTLVKTHQPAGRYMLNWVANEFSSGLYFIRFQAGKEFIVVRKLLLLK